MNNVNVQDREEFDLRLLTTVDNLRLVASEPRKGCKTRGKKTAVKPAEHAVLLNFLRYRYWINWKRQKNKINSWHLKRNHLKKVTSAADFFSYCGEKMSLSKYHCKKNGTRISFEDSCANYVFHLYLESFSFFIQFFLSKECFNYWILNWKSWKFLDCNFFPL